MEKYYFLKFSDYEKQYFETLYNIGLKGGQQFEGMIAVEFLKLSDISPVQNILAC